MRSHGPDPSDFRRLVVDLARRFEEHPTLGSDAEFAKMAGRVLRHQFDGSPAYRSLCERRGIARDDLDRWEESPMVPAMAFQHLDLSSVPGEPEAVFRTSGTSTGGRRRGRHPVPVLALYRASLLPPFRLHLLGGGGPMRFVSLVPPAGGVPDSSLSYMVTAAADALATGVDWMVGGDGRLDVAALRRVARETGAAGEPVLLLGTALALLHALERLDGEPLPFASGTRIMETGGFKGRDRAVPRDELYGRLSAATGVPPERIVNEYGMTELLSQLYEPVLAEGESARGWHVPPPWLRVRAVDPVSLAPLPEGGEGLLAFFDLANAGSVSHVLTQDVGAVRAGRVHLSGRLLGAEPRGCSRAMDELMAAAG